MRVCQMVPFWAILDNFQAVLDGVPPTALELLRSERVLSTLWKEGLEHLEKWSKVVATSRAPPEELYEILHLFFLRFYAIPPLNAYHRQPGKAAR